MTPPSRPRRSPAASRTTRSSTGKARRPAPAKPSSRAADAGATAAAAPLSATQRRYLRSLCHSLKPLVMLGSKGITDNVKVELGHTLDHHELVKVKLSGGDREERQQQVDALLDATGAELVQQIGHVVSLFRRNPDKPGLALPA